MRFNCVVFRVNSSPFVLNVVLRHFKDSDPEFASKLLDSFYVDDVVSGCKDREGALALFKKARERMSAGGFRLIKWKIKDY